MKRIIYEITIYLWIIGIYCNLWPHYILQGITNLAENQRAHMEGRIEPIHDPSMRVEWYHNGTVLQSAARFHTTFDFGYVALDVTGVYEEDSGVYTCRVFNNMGEANSSITFKIEGKSGVIYESARPEGLEKIREMEDHTRGSRKVYLMHEINIYILISSVGKSCV